MLAAYLLAVQSILSAYAMGVLAGPRQPDGAGFVICTLHGVAPQPEDEGPQETQQSLGYCEWACSTLPVAVPPPATSVQKGIVERIETAAFFPPHAPILNIERKGRPGNPRAPPKLG